MLISISLALQLARLELLAEAVARALAALAGLLILRQRAVGREQGVENPLLDVLLGGFLHRLGHFLAHQVHGPLDEVADHALNIAAEIAHLGVLGRFHLDERGAYQVRQSPGDLGLSHAGRAAHDDVFRGDLAGDLLGKLLPPPAVADGDGDGPLGVILADDVAVQLGDDLAGRQMGHEADRSPTLESRRLQRPQA